MLRRTFLRSAGVGALAVNRVGVALLAPPTTSKLPPCTAEGLRNHVRSAKTAFQACKYAELTHMLPGMLAAADEATADANIPRSEALAAKTDLLHVATSLLLKQGTTDLALVAADRASRAADASGDPVAQLAAARILTHASFAAGHGGVASEVVTRNADHFAATVDGSSPTLSSVYGALLLRGAVASAKHRDRQRSAALLNEAGKLAETVSPAANHAWTSFNSNNVLLHRVAIAVELGDAGEAIDCARRVDVSTVSILERRAALWVDVARAFGQWHKDDEAVRALLTAERIAPQEVHGRPAVQQLVAQLLRQQNGPSNHLLRTLASRVGVAG